MQFATKEIKKAEMANGGSGGYSIPRVQEPEPTPIVEPIKEEQSVEEESKIIEEITPVAEETTQQQSTDLGKFEISEDVKIEQAPDHPEDAVDSDYFAPGQTENIYAEEKKKWWGQTVFDNKRERFGLMLIVVGILFVSIVSVSHLVTYFNVGNNPAESWLAALAFEILSFGSIAAFVLLPKIKRWALWISLFLLYLLQVLGNTYATYDYINPATAQHFFEFFGFTITELVGKRIAAIILSAILPTTSFIFAQLIKPYFVKKVDKTTN